MVLNGLFEILLIEEVVRKLENRDRGVPVVKSVEFLIQLNCEKLNRNRFIVFLLQKLHESDVLANLDELFVVESVTVEDHVLGTLQHVQSVFIFLSLH